MNGAENIGFWAAVSIAFMQGLVGSLHCVGMCGPFVHLLNGGARKRGTASGTESARGQTSNSDNLHSGPASPASQPGASSATSEFQVLSDGPISPTPAMAGHGGIAAASHFSGIVRRIPVNLMYNIARSFSYMTVGFALGIAGKTLNLYVVNSIAAVLAAALIIYFGLSFLFPALPGFHGIRMPGWFNRSIGQLLRGRNNPLESAALMGLVTGLLPCGLLYPAYGMALGTGEPLAGAFLMFVFSLGMYPALLVVGLASSTFWEFLRKRWPARILGIIMIAYGMFIVYQRWSHAGQF